MSSKPHNPNSEPFNVFLKKGSSLMHKEAYMAMVETKIKFKYWKGVTALKSR